jgi:signal transduction histidine kinase
LRVSCDLRHLGAALQELLANAVVHSTPGGSVEVEIGRKDVSVCLSIRDYDPGIAADVLARCLEPFAQGADAMTRAQEGLGLGLPLARRLVERHGGTLVLTPAEPGVQAEVVLPPSATAAEPADAGRVAAA